MQAPVHIDIIKTNKGTFMNKRILAFFSLIVVVPLTGCFTESSNKFNELILNENTQLDFDVNLFPVYTSDGFPVWFEYENLSQYEPLNSENGFVHMNDGGFLKLKTPFNRLEQITITYSKKTEGGLFSFELPYSFDQPFEKESITVDSNNKYVAKNDSGYDCELFEIECKNSINGIDIKEIKIEFRSIEYANYDDAIFEENDEGGYTLDNYSNGHKWKKVYIPNEINGKPVNKIGSHAFSNYYNEESVIEEIFIPDSILEIEEFAFISQKKLRTIHLNETTNLQKVGEGIFYGCESLDYVFFPKTIREFHQEALIRGRYSYREKMTFAKFYFEGKNIYGLMSNVEYGSPISLLFFECDSDHFAFVDNCAYYNNYGRAALIDVVNTAENINVKNVVDFNGKAIPTDTIENYAFDLFSQTKNIVLPNYLRKVSIYPEFHSYNFTKDSYLQLELDRYGLTSLPNLHFTSYGGGKYLGTSSNPYYLFVDVEDNVSSFFFNDNTKISCVGYVLDEKIKRFATTYDGLPYVKSYGNQYFACCLDNYTLSSSSDSRIVCDDTKFVFNNGGGKIVLPKSLIFISDHPSNIRYHYSIDYSNTHYETVDGSLYELHITGNTLIRASRFNYQTASQNSQFRVADGTKYIESGCFYCYFFEEYYGDTLLLPDSLVAISDYASYGSEDSVLLNMNIPTNLCSLGNILGIAKPNSNIVVSPSNTHFKSVNGLLTSADDKTLYFYSSTDTLNATIPQTIENIENYAIHCTNVFLESEVVFVSNKSGGWIFYSNDFNRNKGWISNVRSCFFDDEYCIEDQMIYLKNQSNSASLIGQISLNWGEVKSNVQIGNQTFPVKQIGDEKVDSEYRHYLLLGTYTRTSLLILPNTIETIKPTSVSATITVYFKNNIKVIGNYGLFVSTIYCQQTERPQAWDSYWNGGKGNVTWGVDEPPTL